MSEASASHAADRRELTAAQRNAVAELLRVSPVADELGRRFAAAGHELHLVGGSVRDALLGRLGDDLDFCTDAHPDQTLRILKGWAEAIWETGREFGTIGAQRDGLRLEITTFRAEAYDRVSRNPVVRVRHQPRSTTCRRRDFTINAMAVSLPEHRFTDPYGGLADLAAKVIRTPGTPQESFGDDPLRMLRAARFAAQLRFAVAPGRARGDAPDGRRPGPDHRRADPGRVHQAALRRRPDHRAAAAGRHRAGRAVPAGADRAASWRSTSTPSTRTSTSTRSPWSSNAIGAGGRTAATSCCGWPRCMHDVGKPATKAVGPDGRVSFHHHEVVGARLTRQRMKALRYPKDVTSQVVDAGRAAPALLRVRPGRVDRLGGAPLRHRRR